MKSEMILLLQDAKHSTSGFRVKDIFWEDARVELCRKFDEWFSKVTPDILSISIVKRDGGDPIEFWYEMTILFRRL